MTATWRNIGRTHVHRRTAKLELTHGCAEGKMNMPSVLISHPTGNQNVRNALRSLVENEMLAEFWTTIAWSPDARWNQVLPSGLRMQLSQARFCRGSARAREVRSLERGRPPGRKAPAAEKPALFRRAALFHHRYVPALRWQGGAAPEREQS